MRYCLLMHYQEGPEVGLTEEDMAPAMAAFQQYADDLSAAGVLIGTEVLESVVATTTVTARNGIPEVQDVFYDSKQQAYEEYKQMFAGSPTLIQNVDPNALPASFRVKLHDPSKVDSVRSQLIGRAGIDSVTFGGDAVKKLLRINALLRTISLVMTILLLTAATVLIANTIRLAIYARRREIGVMKLVGATNWFIRVPFIFEGVVEAVAGAIVAAGVIWLAKMLWLDRLSSFLAFLPIGITAATVAKMFLVLVVVGITVGALGSTLALRRFLEV